MRLGSIVLTSVLLGVPRALEARTFGQRRPVYVEVAPRSPGLLAFGEALGRALDAAGRASGPRHATAVQLVDVLHLASLRDALGRAVEMITLVVREGRRMRRILLHADAGRRDDAARELLARLEPGDC